MTAAARAWGWLALACAVLDLAGRLAELDEHRPLNAKTRRKVARAWDAAFARGEWAHIDLIRRATAVRSASTQVARLLSRVSTTT